MLIPEAIRNRLRARIADALKALSIEIAPEGVRIEYPLELSHGDYASGVAMQFAKRVGTSPRELAEKIVSSLGSIEGVEKIEIAGPGFINVTLARAELVTYVDFANNDAWGRGVPQEKTVIIDYTQPNPFKPFHIGHLMSNATGEALSRLYESNGAKVIRVNYQGDVGLHIGKAIWGLQQMNVSPDNAETIGKAYAFGAQAYETDPGAKDAIHTINKAVYDRSDEVVNKIYDRGRKTSLDHFEELYKVLGTKFDDYFFEGEVWEAGMQIVRANIPTVFEESDGAVIFPGEKYGMNTRVFITSTGLPTYEGKEMGLIDAKFKKYSPNLSIVTTATEQENFFKITGKAAALIDPAKEGKLVHVAHGMMRLDSGKMSSRTGDVITGESLLHELIEQAKVRAAESRADDKDQLAQDVAVAAIKFQILRQSSAKDIIFDRERALSLEGDSGPYLQYAHARAHQIVAKASADGVGMAADPTAESTAVTRLLHRFPEVVESAAELMEPHIVTTYLIEVASAYNSWYAQEQILDGTPAAGHKVAVVNAVRQTLKNGLWILGIPAPEKM